MPFTLPQFNVRENASAVEIVDAAIAAVEDELDLLNRCGMPSPRGNKASAYWPVLAALNQMREALRNPPPPGPPRSPRTLREWLAVELARGGVPELHQLRDLLPEGADLVFTTCAPVAGHS